MSIPNRIAVQPDKAAATRMTAWLFLRWGPFQVSDDGTQKKRVGASEIASGEFPLR